MHEPQFGQSLAAARQFKDLPQISAKAQVHLCDIIKGRFLKRLKLSCCRFWVVH